MSDTSAPAGDFGPVLRGGRGHRGWRRVLVVLGAVLGLSAVTATATAGALFYYAHSSLSRTDVPGLGTPTETATVASAGASEEVPVDEFTDVLNVLIVGRDSREGLSDQELQELGTEDEGTNLTDTIILLQLDPRRDAAAMLSFPRDLYVERCDGTNGRINAAWFVGEQEEEGQGPGCLVRTVEELTGIPLDHYLEVDLAGFIEVVDTLGGVTFYLDEPLEDRYAGLDVPAGCVTFDGKRALAFVRARHLDNDFGRIARQQRFAREMLAEATSAGTLADVPKLFSLVGAVARALHVDEGLSVSQMRRIAFSLRDVTTGGLVTKTVPGEIRTIGGASYVVADEEAAAELFEAFRTGEVIPDDLPTQAPSLEPAPPPGPESVEPVKVLNGAGVAGIAAEAAEALEERGFAIAETGNAGAFGFDRSRIVYPEGREDEARILAEALGGDVELVAGSAEADLTLVVGSDFEADDLPPPSPRPSPSPSETPSETPSEEPGRQYAAAQPSSRSC